MPLRALGMTQLLRLITVCVKNSPKSCRDTLRIYSQYWRFESVLIPVGIEVNIHIYVAIEYADVADASQGAISLFSS